MHALEEIGVESLARLETAMMDDVHRDRRRLTDLAALLDATLAQLGSPDPGRT